jgi:putative iron-dependent peroxidase
VAEPQAILVPFTESAVFLVLGIEPGHEDGVRDVLAGASGLRRSVGFRFPEAELTLVTGIGSDAWNRLFGAPRPAELHPFGALNGPVHSAPSTPGDLLFHIRSHRQDLCFELTQRLMERLAGHVRLIDEVYGFRSFDQRDLLGFVDGTENPEGEEAAAAVVVGEEDAAFAGGAYVIVQKYVHDLKAWDALSIEEQEAAIGRLKLSDIEIPDEEKAPDAHVALNVIEGPDGEELEIVRYNMPFGRAAAGEFGTYFIGYSRTPSITEQMLENMFMGTPHDRILDFSTAVTGTLFFAPSAAFLDDPPAPPAQAAGPGESSLGIGGMRRS